METAANPSLVITVEVLLRARHSTKQDKTRHSNSRTSNFLKIRYLDP